MSGIPASYSGASKEIVLWHADAPYDVRMPPETPENHAESAIAFGIASPSSDVASPLRELFAWIGSRANVALEQRDFGSYQALANAMQHGEIDLGWLPPIVHMHLADQGGVVPLATSHRSGRASYQCLLVVREDASIRALDDLRGKRAAWVDPWSAAGYVLPRSHLAARGFDLTNFFSNETFYAGHAAALRAVTNGEADVAGTYGISTGPSTGPDLRVLASLGAIPSDVIGARLALPADVRGRIGAAFVDAGKEAEMSARIRAIFGVESFIEGGDATYAAHRDPISDDVAAGLLRAVDEIAKRA